MRDFLHRFFVPKENNNFRAKALHTDFLTLYLIVALVLTVVAKQMTTVPNVLGIATDISTTKLLNLTNKEREAHSLGSLTYNEQLAQAAYNKARDMFKKNYWAHYAPDGTAPWEFIVAANYNYEYAGENLAKNFMFSEGVVDAWMKSPTHRENLLRKEYDEVGFAVVNGILNGEETTLVVQMFGKESTDGTTQVPIKKAQIPRANQNIDVLAQKTPSSFSIPQIQLNINVLFIGFILMILVLDLYHSTRIKVTRTGGKNVAHIIFVLFMLLGLVILTKGALV